VVLEKISGRPLISRKALHPTRPSWRRALKILEGVGPLLSQLHEAGWVWRDCKPAHIFWNKGVIRLIDFEGACHLDETELLPWGSRNYVPPEYRGKFSRRPGVLEDHYALGVIAFQLMCGEFPPNHWHSHSSLYKRADCPDFLRAWTDNLLRC
jgi:serine/threonine protein kinase